MLKKLFMLFLFSILVVQCDIPSSNDTMDPHVELIFPREGNVISTNIQIRIKAADNEKIEKVWA